MCIEYPENEVLLEYANSLFDFQNVYNEMQRIREVGAQRGQISIQHFFDGWIITRELSRRHIVKI
ncbi:DNA-binding domain-containing protein [Pediococcus pentosaceus]